MFARGLALAFLRNRQSTATRTSGSATRCMLHLSGEIHVSAICSPVWEGQGGYQGANRTDRLDSSAAGLVVGAGLRLRPLF